MSGEPFSKDAQLARGERRYRRKVASPKQWQAIIAAKRGPCRVYGEFGRFVLTKDCSACNRVAGVVACILCAKWEIAERRESGTESPQLADGVIEYHHLLPRSQGGDDVADNIVPLSSAGHLAVTTRDSVALQALSESLSHSEYAYLLEKVGEPGIVRLFGVPWPPARKSRQINE